jgi:hypothetical protein
MCNSSKKSLTFIAQTLELFPAIRIFPDLVRKNENRKDAALSGSICFQNNKPKLSLNLKL